MYIDYSSSVVPGEYTCAYCHRTGLKLWRQYQTFRPKLLCATCAGADQGFTDLTINEEGKRFDGTRYSDQIGGYVPAIPDEEGVGYWGYTSVPAEGIAWWRRLPVQETNT